MVGLPQAAPHAGGPQAARVGVWWAADPQEVRREAPLVEDPCMARQVKLAAELLMAV